MPGGDVCSLVSRILFSPELTCKQRNGTRACKIRVTIVRLSEEVDAVWRTTPKRFRPGLATLPVRI
jgi:hypothetical protein